MIFNRKLEIKFEHGSEKILDGQSKICNWLYNRLLELTIEDYRNNDNKKKLLSGRNLRNEVPKLKKEFSFLCSVHSSPLKNTALRLKQNFKDFFSVKGRGYPRFRSWKGKWFSLYYDEPNKGFKVKENIISLTLGKREDGKRIYVEGKLNEGLNLRKEDEIKNFRLCKEQGRFYGIFCIEREDYKEKELKTWLSIDPNHKNFFVAIDDKGKSFSFEKLKLLKYWDKKIDILKSKRDKCLRKAKLIKTGKGRNYYLPSKRWQRLNRALNKAYNCRREQIKSVCFRVSNYIAQNYDTVAIGDYTPSLDTAIYDRMHRSMLNQEVIGKFRNILEWVMRRSGKKYIKVNEKGTTKTCCICGYEEKKGPQIREFTCPNCNRTLERDINSSVNMAKKSNLLSGSGYKEWDLSRTLYTVKWNFRTSEFLFTGCAFSTEELNREDDTSRAKSNSMSNVSYN